jgi:hypothetical protein
MPRVDASAIAQFMASRSPSLLPHRGVSSIFLRGGVFFARQETGQDHADSSQGEDFSHSKSVAHISGAFVDPNHALTYT